MARKKKATQTPVKITRSNSSNIRYEGKVTVSISKGSKIISSKEYKNSGRYPLFQFVTECLQGAYSTAELHRPRSIVVYSINEQNVPEILDNVDNTSDNSIRKYCNEKNRVSYSDISFKSIPQITTDIQENGIGSSSIKYSFLVPFTQLGEGLNGKINLVALYSTSNRKLLDNPSAFFFVRDDKDPNKLGNLIPETEYGADVSNYNLIIDWTLTVGNN